MIQEALSHTPPQHVSLTSQVFRTYNASITLDKLLRDQEALRDSAATVDERKADYDRANKEVAILCNHQRSVPKAHLDQVGVVLKV